MKNTFLNVCLVIGSTYVTLLVTNILILQFYQALVFDFRDRHEILSELHRAGIKAFPMAPPSFLIENQISGFGPDSLIPVSGIANVLTIYCNENGYFTRYTSDRYGFNNPDQIWEDNSPDVILIGDSFTQGACVNNEDSIAGKMRANGSAVLNLGMGGHGPLLELATLVEFGSEKQADTLLWIYTEANDLSFLGAEMKHGYLNQYLEGNFNKGLKHHQRTVDAGWKQLISDSKADTPAPKDAESNLLLGALTLNNYRTLFRNIIRSQQAVSNRDNVWRDLMTRSRIVEELMTHLEWNARANIETFGKVLTMAKHLADSNDTALYFVYLPSYERYQYDLDTYQDEIIDLARGLGVPVINFAIYMDSHPDPLSLFPFGRRGHLSPEGYDALTSLIIESTSSRRQPSNDNLL